MAKYLLLLSLIFPSVLFAQNHYVRVGASGTENGTDWTNAYTALPTTLLRGDTYYVADGDYFAYTFDDVENGTQYITIKKATVSDHGTENGWNNAYGDGQAVFGAAIAFATGYYVFDGNGTFTIPSSTSSDYGFKINSNSSTNYNPGIVAFAGTSSKITMKYVHVYNSTNGSINNGTVSLRFTSTTAPGKVKIQNCFIENSGKDGIQISGATYVLIERSYMKRLGKLEPGSPDYHGQTVQIFYGGSDIVMRWNTWEANEGQGLVQIAARLDGTGPSERIRFYGNVVFVRYGGTSDTPGFNVSGGILGNAWNYNALNYIISYNNSFVNIGGDYGGYASHPLVKGGNNNFLYNNLYYNAQNVGIDGTWNASGYHASGGGDTISDTSTQTNITSTIFKNYTNNDFRLSSPTAPGRTLTSELWWSGGSDSFFGQVDSATDMYGNIRGADGNWDRGAYEYIGGKFPIFPSIIIY